VQVAALADIIPKPLEPHPVEEEFDVTFEIHGFDMGSMLPEPHSPQVLPYCCTEAVLRMEFQRPQSLIERAILHFRDVTEYVKAREFTLSSAYLPSIYYTPTHDTFVIFRGSPDSYLPWNLRVSATM